MTRQRVLWYGGGCALVAVLTGSISFPADILVDDFSSGEYHKAVAETTLDPTPGTMLGAHRRMYIAVTNNAFGQTANVDIVPRTGVMAVNTGIRSFVRVELRYGYGPTGGAAPLNLDLSRHDNISVEVQAADRPINFNVVLFSTDGRARASSAIAIPARASDQTVKMALATFSGTSGFDLSDIDHLAVIFQSTGAQAGNDFVVSEIRIGG